jgi:hypothetical protein
MITVMRPASGQEKNFLFLDMISVAAALETAAARPRRLRLACRNHRRDLRHATAARTLRGHTPAAASAYVHARAETGAPMRPAGIWRCSRSRAPRTAVRARTTLMG